MAAAHSTGSGGYSYGSSVGSHPRLSPRELVEEYRRTSGTLAASSSPSLLPSLLSRDRQGQAGLGQAGYVEPGQGSGWQQGANSGQGGQGLPSGGSWRPPAGGSLYGDPSATDLATHMAGLDAALSALAQSSPQ